jgi:hypothetical protein
MSTESRTMHPAVREARVAERIDLLRASLAGVEPPAGLEATLREAFRERRKKLARAARPRLWWMPPRALAATLGAVSWIVRGPAPRPAPERPVMAAEADAGAFLALKPLDRIALEPAATVVATEFPRSLLAQWGLPVAPEHAGEPVRAEMLYSPGGEALAIRLLN